MSAEKLPPVYLGLPMWQHPWWPANWFQRSEARHQQLRFYSRHLNSVEGNTTFYSLPHEDAVHRWNDATDDTFSFTFKFNQLISHEKKLIHCEQDAAQQLHLLSPLKQKLGVVMLQLPASFGPAELPLLADFLRALPRTTQYAVEVRHPAFFAKGDAERALNHLLIQQHVNRVIMDTRALFSGPATSDIVADVRQKKPRVPVNVIATGAAPVVRFVGNDNEQDNARCLTPWVSKIHQWRTEGRTPYLFIHRPDNKDAPWLAQQFVNLYNQRHPAHALADIVIHHAPDQNTLF